MKKYALLLLIYGFFIPADVFAMEPPGFHAPSSRKELEVIDFVNKNTNGSGIPYLIAPIDLNNDLIDEFVVKPQNLSDCRQKPLCPHQIIAFKDYSPIVIGNFDAHKILISDKKTYGIRHIIVYNTSYNDFKSETARWSPYEYRYELD